MGAPAFFVLGAGRSGTSILQEILSMHPQLVVSHELRVLELAVLTAALFDRDGDSVVDEKAPKSPEGLELGVEFVARLADEQLRAAGKGGALYADKYPPYCEQIAFLDKLWPSARFVHILRDGRDVVASALQAYVTDRGWRRSPSVPDVQALAAHWAKAVRIARAYGARLPRERYHELRYEDLSREPAKVLAELLRFLGLEPGASFEAMAKKMRPGKTWRETLSHDDLVQFEGVAEASALNAELGLPPTPLEPSDAGADTTESHWTAAIATTRQWAEHGDAALAAGDERKALFCYLRAIRGKSKDARAVLALLALHRRPESLFAALTARAGHDPGTKAAFADWIEGRGLDRAAARAVMGLGGGAP